MPDTFIENLIVLLIALLFVKDIAILWFKKMLGIEIEDSSILLKEVHSKMDRLMNYNNHETTKNLDNIYSNQKEIIGSLNKISNHQDLIRTDVSLVKLKQDEWEKHGIKINKNV